MKLIVICGFLGSGKTTFLQSFLKRNAHFKIGVVMNEISSIDVDGTKLELKEHQFESITNGSIFCVCKSDQFVDALLKLSGYDLDYIIVESSGLADPSSINSIIEFVQARSTITFEGIITVVPTNIIHKLISTCEVVKKQIQYASVILLSKCDLVSQNTITNAISIMKEYNKDAVVSQMILGNYDDTIISSIIPMVHQEQEISHTIKHKKVLFQIASRITKETLHLFFQSLGNDVDRIKGFVKIDEKKYFCEYIDSTFNLEEVYSLEAIDLIAAISTSDGSLKQWVRECATKHNINIEFK
jgi:G3E family GTPase